MLLRARALWSDAGRTGHADPRSLPVRTSMADIATVEEAVTAERLGFDLWALRSTAIPQKLPGMCWRK